MADPRWLDEEEQRTWQHFLLMQFQLNAHIARELIADGLSHQDYMVLANLSDLEGQEARIVELGCTLGWEKSRMSHHISRMEARGLVTKVQCPTDQRGWFVRMTDAGREAIAAAAPNHVEVVRRRFIDLLSRDELRTLDDISTRVLDRLPDGS